MQDHSSAGHGSVLDGAQVSIPARAVDLLRQALYAEIGLAAEAIDAVAFARDREAHPEWFRGPAESLRESYALLDTIGWSRTDPPVAVRIDLRRDGWALVRALSRALEFADEEVSERTRRDVKQRGVAAERECVGILCDFTAVVQARIDALAVEEGAEPVLDLAA
ncbi:MAG: hypothetical protein ACRDK7_10810 [Solirubrobacteraceae bacterium]